MRSGLDRQIRSYLISIAAFILGLVSLLQPAAAEPAIEPLVGFEIGPSPSGSNSVMRAPFYLHDDGYFYGTSLGGGAFGAGTVMRISKAGVLDGLPFASGATHQPGEAPLSSLVPSSDGWLWGTTSGTTLGYGTIFRVKPETGAFQTMHHFASGVGNSPSCGLVSDGQGYFWGVTRYTNSGNLTNGILFKIHELAGDFTRVYTFPGNSSSSANGRVPEGGLYHDGAGNLWGTTSLGGTNGRGTVFKYTISTGTLTNIVHFGALHGSNPVSALVPDGNGFLWGATPTGGNTLNFGTVFKVEMATNTATSVVEFSNNGATNKGQLPKGPLVNDGAGNLWGVTTSGASGDKGSVFKISSATGLLTTVLQFGSLTGTNVNVRNPVNALTLDGEGNLWGIATSGGGAATWAVYKIRISDGAFTKVAEQQPGGVSYKGRYPLAGLAGNATSPWLWGTTSEGGNHNLGTLFRYNPSTGEHNTVIHFTGTTGTALGSKPNGKLFVDAAGVVWGTTEAGGSVGAPTGYGTIFKYDPTPGTFTTVQSLGSTSSNPRGALVGMSDGSIWGTTSYGVSGNRGNVFKIAPTNNVVTVVYNFADASKAINGSEPQCGLVEDASGFVWGTTLRGGSNSNGMLFKIEMATGAFTPVRSFASGSSGTSGNLVIDAAGNIYGNSGAGVFKYAPSTSTYTQISIDAVVSSAGSTADTLYKTASGDIRFLGTEATVDLPAPNNYAIPRAVIYQINPSTNTATKIQALAEGTVGNSFPADLPSVGGLHEHTDGAFYGITRSSGTDEDLAPAGGGMIYRVSTGPSLMTQPYDANPFSSSQILTLVSGTATTLRGYANPNGNATTCEFEWGPTTELGNTVPASSPVGTGFTGGMSQAVLSGLSANRNYFYRLRANSTGEPSYGPILSLQTGTPVSPTTQEISVESPVGQVLTDNVTPVDLGRLLVGKTNKQAVVVRNLTWGIELSGLTATITGPNAGDFVITKPFDLTSLPTAPVTPTSAMSTGLIVTFTPGGGGTRTATLTITSNDADEGSFEIPLTGTGLVQPEIEVDSPASLALQSDEGTYDFGNSAVNAGTARTFTIRNTGIAPLTNLNVMVRGIHTSNFTVTSQPPASIAPGSSGTFTATFTPSVAGARSATLQIASNDDDENPFNIGVSGTGIIAPEIQVLDDTINLLDGVSTLAFGTLGMGTAANRIITIRNVGSANLTGISLSLTGSNATDFSFGTVATSVPAGQQITFTLTFFPLTLGAKSATLRIASIDSDENPFDIALTATAATTSDPVDTFLADAGIPANLRGPNDDADNDGLDNLIEYALDLNPNGNGGAFTGSLPFATTTPEHFHFTYRRVRNDVTYTVETSPTLTGGTWTSVGVTQGTPGPDGTTVASLPIAPGSAFLRLVVTRNP